MLLRKRGFSFSPHIFWPFLLSSFCSPSWILSLSLSLSPLVHAWTSSSSPSAQLQSNPQVLQNDIWLPWTGWVSLFRLKNSHRSLLIKITLKTPSLASPLTLTTSPVQMSQATASISLLTRLLHPSTSLPLSAYLKHSIETIKLKVVFHHTLSYLFLVFVKLK